MNRVANETREIADHLGIIRSGGAPPVIYELYEREAPGIYFSSVVAHELLAGAL